MKDFILLRKDISPEIACSNSIYSGLGKLILSINFNSGWLKASVAVFASGGPGFQVQIDAGLAHRRQALQELPIHG